ncbi:MAG: hypothetical protein M3442_05620 [Chloroflexota bacterium]|nr:hypothetical protein [Chloroflexota bacterium]
MSSAGLQTVEEAEPQVQAVEPDALGASRRTRRILGAVEQYKALCAAREEQPSEEDSWLVLLGAVTDSEARD